MQLFKPKGDNDTILQIGCDKLSVLKPYGDNPDFKPSTTYKINNNRIEGKIDGLDSVKQAANLALTIERFEHLIYSLDYGNELNGFIGKPRDYATGDIERRILEALIQDDRIEGIEDFALSFSGESAIISFTIISTFGNFKMERGVLLG